MFKRNTIAGSYNELLTCRTTDNNWLLRTDNTTPPYVDFFDWTSGVQKEVGNTTDVSIGIADIITVQRDGADSLTVWEYNGSDKKTVTGLGSSQMTYSSSEIVLGAEANQVGLNLGGVIYEVIICNASITAGERNIVENYLAQK